MGLSHGARGVERGVTRVRLDNVRGRLKGVVGFDDLAVEEVLPGLHHVRLDVRLHDARVVGWRGLNGHGLRDHDVLRPGYGRPDNAPP